MTKALLISLIALFTGLSACSSVNKDAEVNSFIGDMDQLASDIVRTVEAKPGVSGVEQAQKLLDERRPQLKANFDKLKDVRGFQVSKATTEKFEAAVSKNVELVGGLQIKYADKSAEDAAFGNKLNKLSSDFNSIFGV